MACSFVMGSISMGREYKHAYFCNASTLLLPPYKLPYMTMALKDRLIYAREQSGYPKPKPAADKAGITPSALYQLEDGTTKSLSGNTAHKLGLIYPDFRIEWLISGSGPRRRSGLSVREDLASYNASHSLRMDPSTISAALKLLRLTLENLNLVFDNEADGTPLAYAYEYLATHQEQAVTPENVVDFSKFLDAKLRGVGDDKAPTGYARSTG